MKLTKIVFASLMLSLGITGCASNQLSEAGDKVRILDPMEVATCRKLGETSASTTGSVVGLERPIETVTKELRLIARNAAGRMGGDTIVPLTVITEGQQIFEVYKCINPDG